MTTWGITPTGLNVPTLDDVRDERNAAMRTAFGASLPLDDQKIEGQLVAIQSEREVSVWEAIEALWQALDPDSATGAALDSLCALSGTVRRKAKSSTVVATLVGTSGDTISAGSRAKLGSTGAAFALDLDAVLADVTAWTATTGYVVGDLVGNDSGKVYACTAAGTSAGSGGPTGTSTSISDGSVTWRYVGAGTGVASGGMTALAAGPTVAVAYDLSVIDTPVSGWTAVVNLLDGVTGRVVESDGALRVRRAQELASGGSTTRDALFAELDEVTGVSAVTLFVNDTDVTDADGVPPHAVEALVQGGDDDAIAAVLLAGVAFGIATYTSTSDSGTAVDSEGGSHTEYFSRPVAVDCYVAITLTKDPLVYPADGDARVKAAIAVAQVIGRDLKAARCAAAAFGVPGLIDVTACYVGTAPSPVGSAVAIAARELAVLDTTRVSVTSSDESP